MEPAGINWDLSQYPPQLLRLDQLRLDGGTQFRVSEPEGVIATYADALLRKTPHGEPKPAPVPPAVVFFDREEHAHWLADGFLRLLAHRRIKADRMPCHVLRGTLRDAIRYALQANGSHGCHRTHEDILNAFLAAMRDHIWGSWANTRLAELLNVSESTIRRCREECERDGTVPRIKERAARDPNTGQERTITAGYNAGPRKKTDPHAGIKNFGLPSPTTNGSDCEDTAAAAAPAPAPPDEDRPGKERPVLLDRTGRQVPDILRDVFGDPTLAECIDETEGIATVARDAMNAALKKLKARLKFYPFLLLDAYADRRQHLAQEVSRAVSVLENALPHAVCPVCGGQGALPCCQGAGYLTRSGYDAMLADGRARKGEPA
jgi:hypothetical protein